MADKTELVFDHLLKMNYHILLHFMSIMFLFLYKAHTALAHFLALCVRFSLNMFVFTFSQSMFACR